MIDKTTAGTLYSYGYKLKDSEGNVYDIDTPIGYGFDTYFNGLIKTYIKWEEIGTTYKILARPLEMLTKEIEGKVPIVELAKLCLPYRTWEYKDYYPHLNVAGAKTGSFFFEYAETVKGFKLTENDGDGYELLPVPNQLPLYDKLKEWHFNIGFPEGTTTNLKD